MDEAVTIQANELTVRDAVAFGAGQVHQARRFACRVLALPEVRSLAIEPAAAQARISYRIPAADRKDFLIRLAEAVGAESNPLDEAMLPPWPAGQCVTLSRMGDVVTILQVLDLQASRLRVKHELLVGAKESVVQRVQRVLQTLPGVEHAAASGGTLTLGFDPSRIDSGNLIRAVEIQLSAEADRAKVGDLPAVPFGVANTTVGLGAVGELVLPMATPVAAGVLVATNLNLVRDAAADLGRGKIGVPLFHTALLACSIVTGQVLAYAVTDWSLRFWQQRWRNKLSAEAERLLDEAVPLPEQVRVVMPDGAETWRFPALLTAGDRIRVEAGETIPVDGRAVTGDALVDERVVGGGQLPRRKSAGAKVLAGATLLVGRLDIEAERTGSATTAVQISRTLSGAVTLFPNDRTLQAKSQRLAERTVLPTLATAGVGWAAGDLITVGAILHQDWISGPVLAVPLLALKRIRSALQQGALVRNATALSRMAESDFVVLDGDDPDLAVPGLEVSAMTCRLADSDIVLRHAASAGLFLGDERSEALIRACRERGLVVRHSTLSALTPDGIEARFGERRIRLSDGPAAEARAVPELLMDVDGHEVARLSFRKGARPRAVGAVQRLRAAGLKTFLMASGPEQKTQHLARLIGADLAGGELDTAGKLRFLHGLRCRGVRAIVVGNLSAQPELARHAHVAVTAGGLNGREAVGDVVLLGPSYDSLADLLELARGYEPEVVQASRLAMLPNLLCVAGAFAGLLNGITAGIIANLGIINVDRHLRKAFEETARR